MAIYPLEAHLIHSLDPATLNAGDHLMTRLTRLWTDGTCTLPAGSAIRGEVTARHAWSPEDKQTRITLQFSYACEGQPHALRWIALLAPDDPDLAGVHGDPVATQSFRSSSFGQGDPTRSAGNTQANHVDLSGRQNPSLPLFVDPEPSRAQRPSSVKLGMVWHLPHLGLQVSDGAPPATAITSSHKTFKLPADTVLVMVPEHLPEASVAPSTSTTGRNLRQPVALAPENTQCPATRCSTLSTAVPAYLQPERGFMLRPYGTTRGKTGEIASLEHSTAVAFLGGDELLVTVAMPGLVHRSTPTRPEDHPHRVRALLWNHHTGMLERTAEWSIPNQQQYLWPLGDGRVLVHEADHLTWYGPGLQQQQTLALTGPLAFVSASSDGQHLLVGTIQELHAADTHAELYRNGNKAPEEQVREVVYDSTLQPISESVESSLAMPPLLWNSGRLALRHRGGNTWYFREFAWGGSQRDFGTVTSSCVPQVNALSGDMLLVVGCETHSLNAWARVLRSDGSLVLRSTITPDDLYPIAFSGTGSQFVLVSPRLASSANRDGIFHAADLITETVRVVRSSDGAVQCVTAVHEPTTSLQPAALNAQGDTLATLDGEAVYLYHVVAAVEASHTQTGSR